MTQSPPHYRRDGIALPHPGREGEIDNHDSQPYRRFLALLGEGESSPAPAGGGKPANSLRQSLPDRLPDRVNLVAQVTIEALRGPDAAVAELCRYQLDRGTGRDGSRCRPVSNPVRRGIGGEQAAFLEMPQSVADCVRRPGAVAGVDVKDSEQGESEMSSSVFVDPEGADVEVDFEPSEGFEETRGLLRFYVGGATVSFDHMDAAKIERLSVAVMNAGEQARRYEAKRRLPTVNGSQLIGKAAVITS